MVLFGTGIGFKKKRGDQVDPDLVSKVFHAKSYDQSLSDILKDISPNVLSLTERIIDLAENDLDKKLNTSLLVSLADHLQSAIGRKSNDIFFTENNLQWEIPFLYHHEYELGKKGVEMIREQLGVELPIIEASFIALHFVNAQQSAGSMNETMLITRITKSIVKNIQTYLNVSLQKDTIDYSRFITHIRYFMNRQLHNRQEESGSNQDLYQIIQKQYPDSFGCGLKIREVLKDEYNITVNDDEMIYLVIHIQRIVSTTTK